MDVQDLLVILVLAVLIAYDVMDYFKLRHDMQMYGTRQKIKEKYPQDNMKEFLPPARKYDKADVITTTHRFYPTTNKRKAKDRS